MGDQAATQRPRVHPGVNSPILADAATPRPRGRVLPAYLSLFSETV
jgi:hypothetical protein